MEKVKRLIAAGASIPMAIKDSLGMTIAAFATEYGVSPKSVANHLNGTVRASNETIDALVDHLGGTPDEWRELLWLASKPRSLVQAEDRTEAVA